MTQTYRTAIIANHSLLLLSGEIALLFSIQLIPRCLYSFHEYGAYKGGQRAELKVTGAKRKGKAQKHIAQGNALGIRI